MPVVVFDHHLQDFDAWFELFTANPPPSIGKWRCVRGVEDPNRVHVVGEMQATEIADIKAFFASDRMQNILSQVDAMSTKPIETIWFDDVG